jgi:hypothetical protein
MVLNPDTYNISYSKKYSKSTQIQVTKPGLSTESKPTTKTIQRVFDLRGEDSSLGTGRFNEETLTV